MSIRLCITMVALPLHTMQDAQGTPYVPETQWAGERTSAIDSTCARCMLSYWWFFRSICVCRHMLAQQSSLSWPSMGTWWNAHICHIKYWHSISGTWFHTDGFFALSKAAICIECSPILMTPCARLHAEHRRPFASNSKPGHLKSAIIAAMAAEGNIVQLHKTCQTCVTYY